MDAENVEALVGRYRADIEAAVPGSSVHLSGSTLLREFRGHDIDLVVLVPDVEAAADVLRVMYPSLYEDEWREDWAAFRDPGPPQVDLVVTRPGTKGDAHHRRAWELLLSDGELRDKYLRLKAAGMTSVEKRVFFEGVVRRLTD